MWGGLTIHMFTKSKDRKKLEVHIAESHCSAQSEAQKWCLTHPLQGARAFLAMVRGKEPGEKVVQAWKNLPSWEAYQTAYDELELLDAQEGFPASKQYAAEIDSLVQHLPAECNKAYYPFAGLDFYWAHAFDETVFEDIGYKQKLIANMWWRQEKYQQAGIQAAFSFLQQAGVFQEPKVQLITGNADEEREDNNFNSPEWTLIVKGGHSVIPFLEGRFDGPLSFGACIFISPTDSREDLTSEMTRRGHKLAHYEKGEQFYAPFAMALQHKYLFHRNKF